MMAIHVAAVIPAFNVGKIIGSVLSEMPEMVRTVIVVDDGSADDTAAVVESCARRDARIHLIRHESNRGVGAAMVTGFRKSLELEAAIVVKIDGDGQMPLSMLPKLIEPLIIGQADYVKGNRFRDFQAIRKMPPLRRFGNVALSFLAKVATGYWHCFDPTNGFVAIRAEVLSQMPLHRIDPGYFFEISMLSYLYLLGAVVDEEPMPARYEGEPSSLSIPRVLLNFPGRLFFSFVRRIFLKNFFYDFNVLSLELGVGLPLLLGGILYGGYNWIWYASHGIAAPTGTIVLSALMIILGFQLLLSAIALDLSAVPRAPLNEGPIAFEELFPQRAAIMKGWGDEAGQSEVSSKK
jgi:dolichol-phosphate mannosyltransferase